MGPPIAPADQQTYEALAKMEERHDIERVDVSFSPPRDSPDDAL